MENKKFIDKSDKGRKDNSDVQNLFKKIDVYVSLL